MKTSYIISLFIFLAAAGWIASGVLADDATAPHEGQAHIHAPTPVAQVRFVTSIAEEHQSYLNVKGQVQANRTLDILSETTGRVAALPIEKGQKVEAGDEIITLAADERPARLRESEALVRQKYIEYQAAKKLSVKAYASKVKLAESESELAQARAQRVQAALDLEHTHIKAPFTAIYQERHIEIGEYVAVGAVVAQLVDLDPVKITVHVPENTIEHIETGQIATFKTITGTTFQGRVSYISSVASSDTRTFKIEISAPNPDFTLKKGMTVQVALPIRKTLQHRISPAFLSLNAAGEIGVKLLTPDDKVQFVAIAQSGADPQNIWITGLPKTVRIITLGHDFVADGQSVKAVEMAMGAAAATKAPSSPQDTTTKGQ
jgi:multidrug efflux system membrane fusion protein